MHATAPASRSAILARDGTAMNILLIEDDAEAARFLVKGLRESGYGVEHCADGREGLFRATEGHYDIIIADRMLPHIDGLAIIGLLRKSGNRTPVLILSALGIPKGSSMEGDSLL